MMVVVGGAPKALEGLGRESGRSKGKGIAKKEW
jgi:hypothetical protein